MAQQNAVIQWLLQGDPAIRWQSQRDLLGADEAAVQAERQQVSTTGWGAKLLSYQEPSGLWGGGLFCFIDFRRQAWLRPASCSNSSRLFCYVSAPTCSAVTGCRPPRRFPPAMAWPSTIVNQ